MRKSLRATYAQRLGPCPPGFRRRAGRHQARAGGAKAGREEDGDVHRLPRHPGLPGELSRGPQGADDRGPERQVHRGRAHRLQEGRAQASHHARHRRSRSPTRTSPTSPRTTSSMARKTASAGRQTQPRSRARKWRPCCRRPPACPATAPTSAKPIDRRYPKIAGQHADYLYVGAQGLPDREQPAVGRSNAIMQGRPSSSATPSSRSWPSTSARSRATSRSSLKTSSARL